jgi:ABC-type glycerol-3-phosphate transport system permease component
VFIWNEFFWAYHLHSSPSLRSLLDHSELPCHTLSQGRKRTREERELSVR